MVIFSLSITKIFETKLHPQSLSRNRLSGVIELKTVIYSDVSLDHFSASNYTIPSDDVWHYFIGTMDIIG